MKKEYVVSARGTEWLVETVIEADTPEEAQVKYEEAWSNGEIDALDYEFSHWNIQPVESGEGEEAHAEPQGSDGSSKTYLAKFTIFEGEHEHHGAFLLHAASSEEAYALAKTQEHEDGYPEDEEDEEDEAELTYWDYGDATTAARLDQVTSVTAAEAATLRRLGFAYDFDEGQHQ